MLTANRFLSSRCSEECHLPACTVVELHRKNIDQRYPREMDRFTSGNALEGCLVADLGPMPDAHRHTLLLFRYGRARKVQMASMIVAEVVPRQRPQEAYGQSWKESAVLHV
jgi:hypothetical protein